MAFATVDWTPPSTGVSSVRATPGHSARFLAASGEYRRLCGIDDDDDLPGYNTVQEHTRDVSERYLHHLIRLLSERIMRVQGRTTCNATCDSTRESTSRYGRWFDVRRSRKSKKRRFVKLHGHVTTDSEMPFFLSARVTKGYKGDSRQLPHLLRQKSGEVEIGEMPLDSAFLSRKNAQLIADIGAHPYIALKENTASALSLGYPAWNNMIHEAWENEEEYEEHYHRRSVVEGVFSAFKERFGRSVLSKIRHKSERRGALQGGSVERACLGVSQLSWVNQRAKETVRVFGPSPRPARDEARPSM